MMMVYIFLFTNYIGYISGYWILNQFLISFCFVTHDYDDDDDDEINDNSIEIHPQSCPPHTHIL